MKLAEVELLCLFEILSGRSETSGLLDNRIGWKPESGSNNMALVLATRRILKDGFCCI